MCAAGYYGNPTGGNAALCTPCEIGQYNAMVGQTEMGACVSCTDGKTTENNGATSETLCGEFLKLTYYARLLTEQSL